MRIVNNFVWLLVNNKAREVFASNLFSLYAIFQDGSETLIETFDQLNVYLSNGVDIGIEVGTLPNQ